MSKQEAAAAAESSDRRPGDAGIHASGGRGSRSDSHAVDDAVFDADVFEGGAVAATALAGSGGGAQATADAAVGESAQASGGARMLWLVVVSVTLLLGGLEPVPLPERFPQQDKLYHLLGFAALYFCARFTFPGIRTGGRVAACLALALSIEVAQGLFLPHRTASLADMLANTLGLGVGAACAWAWQRRAATP